MDKKQILARIMRCYNFKTKAELASFLGVTPQTLSNWINRNSIDYDLVLTKCEGEDLGWLLTGKVGIGKPKTEKKSEDFDTPNLTPQNDTPKQDFDTPKRPPKNSGTVSAKAGESAPPENVFSGLTQEEVDKELHEGIRDYLLDMYEKGRAYPAATVKQYQNQIKELTMQVARLEYKNGELLAELAALRGKTGASKASKAPGKGVTGEK